MPSGREPSAHPRSPGSRIVAVTGKRPDGRRPSRRSWTIRASSTATPGVTFTYDRLGRKATAQVDYLVWQGDSWEPDPTTWTFAADPANVHDSQPALGPIDAMPGIYGRRGRPRARPALVRGDRACGTPRNRRLSRPGHPPLPGPHREPTRQPTRSPALGRGKLSDVVRALPTPQTLLQPRKRRFSPAIFLAVRKLG